MRRRHRLGRWGVLALAAAALLGTAGAQQQKKKGAAASAAAAPAAAGTAYADRFGAVCAACHGVGGRSEQEGTPILAGQHSFYAVTQLFLFREGRRDNAGMVAVAKTMTDADLRGFSDYIGTLPPAPPVPPPTPPDPARMRKGQALAQEHKCVFCHGADFAGGQQVPRIAGQREEYLKQTLRGFKTGDRPGYTQAMIGAVSTVPVEDLDTLAYYAARFPGAPAGK